MTRKLIVILAILTIGILAILGTGCTGKIVVGNDGVARFANGTPVPAGEYSYDDKGKIIYQPLTTTVTIATATPTITPTAGASAGIRTATATATRTATSTVTNTVSPATDRIKRLVELDKVYRNQGLEPWLHTAGFTWDGAVQQARQIEEETVIVDGLPKIVASGVQLVATNFHAPYPACFTTDKQFSLDTIGGRSFKPDSTNPSVLVTNGSVSNTLTAYVDCSNWKQLTP